MIHATVRQCGHRCQPLVIGPVAFITQHFTRFMCRSRCGTITAMCRPFWREVAVIDEFSSLRQWRAQNVFEIHTLKRIHINDVVASDVEHSHRRHLLFDAVCCRERGYCDHERRAVVETSSSVRSHAGRTNPAATSNPFVRTGNASNGAARLSAQAYSRVSCPVGSGPRRHPS